MCVKESRRPGLILPPMHFMLLILAFLLCAVVWGFFHANPRGVKAGRLLACNILILALGVAFAAAAAIPLYGDALAQRPDHNPLSRRHAAG
jgi:hypothetical protein